MTVYVVKSIESMKSLNPNSGPTYLIDVNSWFEANGFTHKEMNPVREWIFVEWVNKKIASYTSKKCKEEYVCMIFTDSTQASIRNLGKNLSIHFERDNLEFIYVQ